MATILIVDDDPDVVEACRLFLERDHHKVVCAYNRAEGMKAVAEAKPDLLILDVIMEQADDGIAMAQELRRAGFTTPILMLTSIGKVTGLLATARTTISCRSTTSSRSRSSRRPWCAR